MQLFYTPQILKNDFSLSEEESKHSVRVLRLKNDDIIHLIDGEGGFYEAKITNASHKKCEFTITLEQKEYEKPDRYIHIAMAPTKNIDRFEWFLEKSVEMGISEITPILCEHSERKVIKPERLEKIIISAMKQSLKAYKPKLNTLTNFNDFISNKSKSQKLIAHCYESDCKEPLQLYAGINKETIVLIGPEGDFSENEVSEALKFGYKEVSLGKARLRTETAGVVACCLLNYI